MKIFHNNSHKIVHVFVCSLQTYLLCNQVGCVPTYFRPFYRPNSMLVNGNMWKLDNLSELSMKLWLELEERRYPMCPNQIMSHIILKWRTNQIIRTDFSISDGGNFSTHHDNYMECSLLELNLNPCRMRVWNHMLQWFYDNFGN
jgi:hypothetical protein